MSDSPETDEVRRATDCNALGYGLMTTHACKLERERDEARMYLKWIHDVADSQRKWNFRSLAKEGLMKSENAK
jgi:hypothetical protein